MNSAGRVQWFFSAVLIASVVVVYLVRDALVPFIIAFLLAYLLDPLLDRMEEKKVPRTAAIMILLLLILTAVSVAGLLIYPPLERQVVKVIENQPHYTEEVQKRLTPLIEKISGYDKTRINETIWKTVGKMGDLPLQIIQKLYGIATSMVSSVAGMITALFSLLVIPVATFYFMRDIDRMKEKMLMFVPGRYREKVSEVFSDIDRTLSAFVRGQFTVAVVMAVLYSAGLYFIETPMGLLIGIVAGISSIVPYLSLVIGFLPAVILTYLHFGDFWHLFYVSLLFGGVQVLEGFFLTPRIMGKSIGLHPVAIMLAILIGGMFFGLIGIIIAVPVAAVIKVLLSHLVSFYRSSDYYTGGKNDS